ncbi:fibronectin type III domain-containing protein [Candidatus Peregrinibacteria bacterium]|nr:fibronectin type III domain-containing protein [Candidatus Peregrinibacteria bacterium]
MNTKKSLLALIAAAVLAIPLLAYAAAFPENVSGVAASPVDSTSINVTWNAAKDGAGGLVKNYRIYYDTVSIQLAQQGDYAMQVDTPTNATSYVVTGLEAGTTYYFSLTAFDNAGVESESYSFEASVATPAAQQADITSPTVAKVEAVDKTHVQVEFSEAIRLPALLPETAFTITEQINPSSLLEVEDAWTDAADATGKTVIVETAVQAKDVNYILTAAVAVMDLAGNPIVSGSTDSGLFTGSDLEPVMEQEGAPAAEILAVELPAELPAAEPAPLPPEETLPLPDTTPPEDITSFMLSWKAQLDKFIIVMNWKASLNTAKDLIDQILYQSMDKGTTYGAGTSLGKDATKHELPDMEGGKEYTFKITTKDTVGNESVGVVKSIRLPQTGIGLSLFLLGSALTAGGILRRKQ